jgi:hypothetical protein
LLVEALDQEEWSCQRCQKLEQVKVGRSAQNRSAHNRWDAEAPENSSGVGVVRGGGMVWNGVEWCGMVWNGVGVEFSFASRRWVAHNLISSSGMRGTARRTEYACVIMIETIYWR